MAHKAQQAAQEVGTFFSGGPGTSGREPFEDSTASGPGQQYSSTGKGGELGASGATGTTGGLTGQHQHHGHHAPAGAVGPGGVTGGGPGAGLGEGIRHAHEGHSHHAGHHERQEHSHHGADTTAAGIGSGEYPSTGTKSHSGGLGGTSGLTGGAGSAAAHGEHTDRVGSLNQGGAAYERTTGSGPATSGAAGTDRFDTDKNRSTGLGSDTTAGSGWQGGDRSAEPKSGGLSGVLGTSDKDFINRDRKGEGAYHDDNGPFQKNTSGPGGNTALTGREGTFDKNPIAQAKTRDGDAVHPEDPNYSGSSATSGATGARVGQTDTTHKPTLLEKVKDALT